MTDTDNTAPLSTVHGFDALVAQMQLPVPTMRDGASVHVPMGLAWSLDDGTAGTYDVGNPDGGSLDVISPMGSGQRLASYSSGAAAASGVAGKSALLGFPLESITSRATRIEVFRRLLLFAGDGGTDGDGGVFVEPDAGAGGGSAGGGSAGGGNAAGGGSAAGGSAAGGNAAGGSAGGGETAGGSAAGGDAAGGSAGGSQGGGSAGGSGEPNLTGGGLAPRRVLAFRGGGCSAVPESMVVALLVFAGLLRRRR